MKALIPILFPLLLTAQNPYKRYCGECFTMVNDSVSVDGIWIPIPDEPKLNIETSNTIYLEPEKFVAYYPEPLPELNQAGVSWDNVVNSITFSMLLFSSIIYLLGIFRIKISSYF